MRCMLFYLAGYLLTGIGVLGCSKSAAPTAASGGNSPPATSAPPAAATAANTPAAAALNRDTSDPKIVVQDFLNSLRSGDKELAAGLLSTKAREETAKHDLTVEPPGTPHATYEVGRVEYTNDQKEAAYVSSTWTEKYEDGQSESFEIVWVLRKQTEGWRIAGMATQVPDQEQPLFLNFEDPADMLRKWEAADNEVARKQNEAAAATGQPAPSTTVPR